MSDFRIFRQVRWSMSLKQKRVSAILFQRRRVSRPLFWVDYLIRFCAAHNTLKYCRALSARHRSKCPIFGFFTKFGGRWRWNKNGYRQSCFSVEWYRGRKVKVLAIYGNFSNMRISNIHPTWQTFCFWQWSSLVFTNSLNRLSKLNFFITSSIITLHITMFGGVILELAIVFVEHFRTRARREQLLTFL